MKAYNKVEELVARTNKRLEHTDYRVDIYKYSDRMFGIQLYWLHALILNLVVYRDSVDLGIRFLEDIDNYLIYKNGNKK